MTVAFVDAEKSGVVDAQRGILSFRTFLVFVGRSSGECCFIHGEGTAVQGEEITVIQSAGKGDGISSDIAELCSGRAC